MDRRNFLKLAGLSGLSLMLPWGVSSQASADQATWGGPYLLHMHAGGGWDPTLLCDGKTTEPGTTPSYENKIVTAIENVNGIPVPSQGAGGAKFLLTTQNNPVEDPVHFFQNVGRDVLVFNGVDTETNNPDVGVQALACGHNNLELPALAALFAGQVARDRQVPMAFLASGYYNRTGDVVGISRFPGSKIELLADPFKGAPGEETGLLTDVGSRRILELRNQRLQSLEAQATLPRNKRTLAALRDASKSGDALNLLKSVAQGAPPPIDSFVNDLAPDTRAYLTSNTNPANPAQGVARFIDLGRPIETILRCFQAGVSVSATWAQGGFDTHAQHDTNQTAALGTFLARLRYTLLRAQQLGLRDKLYVLVTSDFGRTPKYNTGNGKDHWNVTSVLLVGPGIRGGRAIGKTDEGHKVLRLSKSNVAETVPDADTRGARLHASHIHRELRRVLGVDRAPFIGQFPLPSGEDALPLLG